MSDTVWVWSGAFLALLGAAVGVVGTLVAQRRTERATARDERRRALARFLGHAMDVVALLSSAPNYEPTVIDRVLVGFHDLMPRSPAAEWADQQRQMTAVLGEAPRRMTSELMQAHASLLLLPLDAAVHREVDAIADYIIRLGSSRTEPLIREWPDRRRSFLQAVADSGDTHLAPSIARAPSGEAVAPAPENGATAAATTALPQEHS